jgi:hypothetical protein
VTEINPAWRPADMKYEEWIEYERARLSGKRQALVDDHESAEPIQGNIIEDGTDGEERQVSSDIKEEGGAIFPV